MSHTSTNSNLSTNLPSSPLGPIAAASITLAKAAAACPSPIRAPDSAPTMLAVGANATKPPTSPPNSSPVSPNSSPLSPSTISSPASFASRRMTASTPAAPPSWPKPAICSSAPSPPSSTSSAPMTKTNPGSSSTSLAPGAIRSPTNRPIGLARPHDAHGPFRFPDTQGRTSPRTIFGCLFRDVFRKGFHSGQNCPQTRDTAYEKRLLLE